MNLISGSKLQSGKYRIIRVLGQGGFGITYLAENMFLDKQVAIKEFFPKELCGRDNTSHLTLGTQNNAETVEKLKSRFLKEAKNIAKLDYPGIVKIHDVFEENNTAYYVMDYIEGISLADMVKVNGPLPESKAIGYVIKVGDALEYIHSRQMTHFDVKPANIMVRKSDNTTILIDFGLSKQYDAHGDATSTIMQGVSHGFSPIELYSANSVATFSPQTDVYSLGATLFFLLTGTVPPSASQVLEEGLQFPADISPDIRSAIKRAMSANRTKRYNSAKDFCSDLSKDNRANINHSIYPYVETVREVANTQSQPPSSYSSASEETQFIEPPHDYESEARQLKDKLDPSNGVGMLLAYLVDIPIGLILVVLLFGLFRDLNVILNLFLSIFIGGIAAICIVGFVSSKIFDHIHNKRIKAWKEEHPDDPRAKYL